MTNREWLQSLDDNTLADFLTVGILTRKKMCTNLPDMEYIDEYKPENIQSVIKDISRSRRYAMKIWLNQEFDMEVL